MTATVFLGVDDVATRLRQAPDTVRVLEIRRDDGDAGPGGHLPGAVPVSLTTDLSRSDAPATAGKRPLPDVDTLQSAARRWGIGKDTSVIVYDHDASFVAARGWWVLRWAGIPDVSILDGGLPAWVAAGHATEELCAPAGPGDVELTAGHLPELDADTAAELGRRGRLLDARTDDAFADGHLPGARNVSSRDTLTAAGTLRGVDELRALYGLDGDAGAVPGLYCGGGVAAAHAAAVLAHLGVTAPLYVGSFSAWSADPARPVEREGGTR